MAASAAMTGADRVHASSRPTQPPLDGLQRELRLAAVRAAGLGHVGAAAAALAAQHLGAGFDEIDRIVRLRQVVGDTHRDAGLAVLGDADDGDDAGAELLLAVVDEPTQVLRIEALDGAGEQLDVAHLAHAVRSAGRAVATASERNLTPGIRELALERTALLCQSLDAVEHLFRPDTQSGRNFAHTVILLIEVGARAIGRQSLDAAHTGSGCALGNDADDADVAGAIDVRATAQLHGPWPVGARRRQAHGHDAHLVAVLLPEQRHGTAFHGLLQRHEARFDRHVLGDDRV